MDEVLTAEFEERGICEVGDDGNLYRVRSSDGKRDYSVRFEGCPEYMNENVQTWSCDCPAGQHGKICKHINAVIAALDAGGY